MELASKEEILSEVLCPHSYYCQICCETIVGDVSISLGYSLSCCNHNFCSECLAGYLISKIQDGDINIKCFWCSASTNFSSQTREIVNNVREQSCHALICESDIEKLLLPSHITEWEKYNRFKFFKTNPNARECPYCFHRQLDGSAEKPEIVCDNESCKKDYCFLHSAAHAGLTCEDYDARERAENSQSQILVNESSKPCPVCKMPISKDGGCNHIKCSFCGCTFCWLCGKEVEDTVFPAHFQWWNPSGCSNLQMNEHDEPSQLARLIARISSYIELLILGPLSVLSTFLSLVICCWIIPVYTAQHPEKKPEPWQRRMGYLLGHCMSSWGMIWIGLLVMLPLGILGGICVVFLFCLGRLGRIVCCIKSSSAPSAAAAALSERPIEETDLILLDIDESSANNIESETSPFPKVYTDGSSYRLTGMSAAPEYNDKCVIVEKSVDAVDEEALISVQLLESEENLGLESSITVKPVNLAALIPTTDNAVGVGLQLLTDKALSDFDSDSTVALMDTVSNMMERVESYIQIGLAAAFAASPSAEIESRDVGFVIDGDGEGGKSVAHDPAIEPISCSPKGDEKV